jgi:acyl-ACP thioesterase
VFASSRIVRSTDVTPAGRLRLDALARYLQEAAEDDLADAEWDEPYTWLARRVAVTVRGYPARRDRVSLRTFCSATGPRWAERTTTLAGPGGDLIQAAAVWVAIAPADGRPVPLGDGFHRLYGASAQGRHVSARLSHPGPPESAAGRRWPLRAVDFDVAGHVNNTVHWAAVEDALAGQDWRPASAELEYHRPVLPGADTRLVTSQAPGELSVWLCHGTERLASGRLTATGPDQPG